MATRLLRSQLLANKLKGVLRSMNTLSKCGDCCPPPAIEDQDKYVQKSCRVALLGALTTTGKALALLLKQNPLISQVFLYDEECTIGLAADLSHLDTHSIAVGFKSRDIHCALRNADIIVLMGLECIRADSSLEQKLKMEGRRLVELGTAAALYAPKAIFVDCVVPLSISLPIVSEMYRQNHWYHPGKVLGSVSQQQMRLNSVLALHQELDPAVVQVPLLGGPEEDILLPLFSRASPHQVPIPEANCMINRFRHVDANAPPCAPPEVKHEYAPHGNAFAINRLVSTIALGLLGDSKAISTAFVRSNIVGVCKHMVSTVKFGAHGIMHNFGVPKLTNFELALFEKITREIGRREDMAKAFLDTIARDEQLTKKLAAAANALAFPENIEYYTPQDAIVYEK